jgi:serine/threonine-protein kinase ATR
MSDMPVAKPVERLFSPFWASIAIEPVKDLLSNPRTIQNMAELLEISVDNFLLLTQSYTLPWLFLWQKADVIERIAQLRGEEEVWRVFYDTKILVPTLGLLLLQNVPDTEKLTRSLFQRFGKLPDLDDLIKSDVGPLFLHLLRLAGEADDTKKLRVSLHFL